MEATTAHRPRKDSGESETAADVVFGTQELLILILSELAATNSNEAIDPHYEGRRNNEVQLASVAGASGMRDLLLAQAVCRQWRNTIAESELLQRLLFFLPSRSGMVAYIDWQLDVADVADYVALGTPLLGATGDEAPHRYPSHWGRNREDAGQFKVFANPLLATKFAILRKGGVYFHERLDNYSQAMQHPNASWRRMLVSQPAIRQLSIVSNELKIGGGTSSMWQLEAVTHLGEYRHLCAMSRIGLRMDRLFSSVSHSFSMQMASIQGADMWEDKWEGLASLETMKTREEDKIVVHTSSESATMRRKLVCFEVDGKRYVPPVRFEELNVFARRMLRWDTTGVREEVMKLIGGGS